MPPDQITLQFSPDFAKAGAYRADQDNQFDPEEPQL
jgi:hypothetical protein